MINVIALYLVFLAIVVVSVILRQYLRGTHDLISLRNIVLGGFIIFQLTGGAYSLYYGPAKNAFLLSDPEVAGLIYAAMATVFLLIFFWSYSRGFLVRNLAARMPVTRAVPGPTMLWMLAIAFLVLCFVLRMSTFVPGVHALANIMANASGAMACGIAAWIWGRNFLNPAVIVGLIVVVLVAALILTTGAFGRRPLVTIGAAILWGIYFSNLRYLKPGYVLPRLAVVSIIPIMGVALFTSARDAGDKDRTGLDHVRAIRHQGDLRVGLMQMLDGQHAGGNSLWLIERYRDGDFDTRPLFTVAYLSVYVVPRHLWEGKPEPLSTHLPHMATVPRVNRDRLTLGPGIIGHAAAEGGWFALIVYAFLGGLLIRFFEEIVQSHLHNPIVILPFATTLGHLLGMPRGETSAFTANFMLGVIGMYIAALVIGKLLEYLYTPASMTHDDEPDWEDAAEGAEWEWSDPAYDYSSLQPSEPGGGSANQ